MDQRSVRDILAGKTYFIRTFGCQMNQHDSERVSGLLDSYAASWRSIPRMPISLSS